jgi:hypothetical protein
MQRGEGIAGVTGGAGLNDAPAMRLTFLFALLPLFLHAEAQRFEFTARASEIDPRAKAHPEIEFVFESKGKPADIQHASVDTRVKAQGKLVIWLMGHSAGLFERVTRSACITRTAGLANSAINLPALTASKTATSASKPPRARTSARSSKSRSRMA